MAALPTVSAAPRAIVPPKLVHCKAACTEQEGHAGVLFGCQGKQAKHAKEGQRDSPDTRPPPGNTDLIRYK